MKLEKLNLGEIIPYENNPRINSLAVDAAVESILQVGYVTPIIIDEDNIILAGHTRLMALEQIGWDKAQCVRIEGLSEEQKKKFRILDNKTAEIAQWDEDLLKEELEALDLGDFSWFDDIINPNLNVESDAETSTGEESGKSVEPSGDIVCPRCHYVLWKADGEEEEGDEDDDFTEG